MSLEQSLDRLAAAIERHAAALENQTAGASADVVAAKVPAGKPPKEKVKVDTKPVIEGTATTVVTETKTTETTTAAVDEFSGEPTATTEETSAADLVGDEPKPFDYDTLKAAILTLAGKGKDGKEKAVALIGEYGVKNAKEVPADKWPELYAKVVAATK